MGSPLTPVASMRDLDHVRVAIEALAQQLGSAWPAALESGDDDVLDRVVGASRALRGAALLLRADGLGGVLDLRSDDRHSSDLQGELQDHLRWP
jgi:hypothetical protein